MTPDDEDPRLRLAFEEARRAVVQQRDDLDALRQRAMQLVSVVSVAVGVLLGFGTNRHHITTIYAGMGAFTVLVAGVCTVLWPRTLFFVNEAEQIVTGYVDQGLSINDTLRWLAVHMSRHARSNRDKVDGMMRAYSISVAAGGSTVILLAISYA